MKVPFNRLDLQWEEIKGDAQEEILSVCSSGNFILGSKVAEFEALFAEYVGAKYAVGVASGTDALKLGALTITREFPSKKIVVFMPSNTFVASYIGIKDALPYCDVKFVKFDESFQICTEDLKEQLAKHGSDYDIKVILPVHLYGFSSDVLKLKEIAKEFDCIIMDDCSQAHGAVSNSGKPVGSDFELSCFSLYPGKNLGAFGDAGIVTTNSEEHYNSLLALRNYGSVKKYVHDVFGYNSRLDSIQAVVLKHKLKHLERWNDQRRASVKEICGKVNNPNIQLVKTPEYCLKPVHHIFPVLVKSREGFMSYLNDAGIQNMIHYPTLLPKLPFINDKSYNCKDDDPIIDSLVSLPIHPFITKEEEEYICSTLNNYQQ